MKLQLMMGRGGRYLKAILLLCLVQYCISFSQAGSEIRANRAPITCFNLSDNATRRYNSSSSDSDSGSTRSSNTKDTPSSGDKESEQNTKYVKGLIDTLESLCDKWIVSGTMATRRRAYNLLQQIERISLDKELALQAGRMVKRCGMPLDPPPPIPPTEHIPAVDQQQDQSSSTSTTGINNNTVNKPMGAMASDADTNVRKDDVTKRLEWEQKHRKATQDSTEDYTGLSDIDQVDNRPRNYPRSALSARMADGEGGDPFLNGVVEGSNNGLDDLSTFANDKKDLQNTMNSDSAASSSTSDISNNVQQAISEDEQSSPLDTDRSMEVIASAKSSEFIARAGSGDAFLGSVLGVGGLDDVLSQIKRRVWIPLAAPPTLLSELGIQPVRGLLLYGNPGCGKTLLARKLGSILSPCRPITIVSGPEILDKFVGSSEKNLREIFDNPPEIYHKYKKNYGDALAKQALHVIVLDEFDAIARRRGGSGGKGDQGDAGVARDSVVNQLLAKMDGVEGLGVPTLLVGLTNKPALIDTALMRPGRFEVQIEVPPPRTVEQRIAILKVHCNSMVANGRVLVKDVPAGSVAWNRLQVSAFMQLFFWCVYIFTNLQFACSCRNLVQTTYPHTQSC